MSTKMITKIDQRGASALNVVAGDQTNYNYPPSVREPGVVEQLLEKLQAEISKDEKARHTVESLMHFYEHQSSDGIVGLEAKLKAGKREEELYHALAKKEQFTKLLEKWGMYASAQEIFAFLLAGVEHQFSMFVYPKIQEIDQAEINQMIDDRIIGPTIQQCGTIVFTLNQGIVMGMLYWLAEQCFVRWHR